MRILGVAFGRVLDWACEGGFGRFVYRMLAWVFGLATAGEVLAHGLTDIAYIYGVLTVGVIVCMYDDN